MNVYRTKMDETLGKGNYEVMRINVPSGPAGGRIAGIRLENGVTFYHGGDTGIFDSMRIIGELYKPDVALIPIGSAFVMNPFQAAHSLKLLRPKVAIPMHYRTFPVLEQSADRFVQFAKQEVPSVKVVALEPGGEFVFE